MNFDELSEEDRYVLRGLVKFLMECYWVDPLSEEANRAYKNEINRLKKEYQDIKKGESCKV